MIARPLAATALTAAALALPAGAAHAADNHSLPGTRSLLAADDTGRVELAVVRPHDDVAADVVVTTRGPHGVWSTPRRLGTTDGSLQLAAAGRGRALLAWSKAGSDSVMARVRRSDGTWSAARTIGTGRWAGTDDADIDARGQAVVGLSYGGANTKLAFRNAAGHWHTEKTPCADTSDLAMDGAGTTYLLCERSSGDPRGDNRTMVLFKKRWGHGWTSQSFGEGANGQLLVAPDGRVSLAIGRYGPASGNYPEVMTNGADVYRQDVLGGRLRRIWHHAGATAVRLAQSRDGHRLQVTWEQLADASKPWSRHSLRTREVRPALGPMHVLEARPRDPSSEDLTDFRFQSAVNRHGGGVVTWQRGTGTTWMQRFTGSGSVLTRRSLPTEPAEWYDLGSSTTVTSDQHVWLSYPRALQKVDDGYGTVYYKDGTVTAMRLN